LPIDILNKNSITYILFLIEICESITEDDLETEIETDICSIVVKKYPLDEESEYKCTVWGNDDDDSTVSDLNIDEFVFFCKDKLISLS